MAIDAMIEQAISEAVKEAEQPEELARRLIAWFKAVASGNEDINNQPAVDRHLEVIFGGTVDKDGEEMDTY